LSIAISKTDVKQWCTEHEYEFLQLEKSTTSETDDDEDEENTHRKQKRRKKKKTLYTKYSIEFGFFYISLSGCTWYTTFNSNT